MPNYFLTTSLVGLLGDLHSCCSYCWRHHKIRSLYVKRQTRHSRQWWVPWLLSLCSKSSRLMLTMPTSESGPKLPYPSPIVSPRWYNYNGLITLSCLLTCTHRIAFDWWSNLFQGLEGMKEFGLVSLVQIAAELLNDRLPEAREAARSTVISIYDAFTENEEQKQESWQNFCQSNLTPLHAQSMVKIISSQ